MHPRYCVIVARYFGVIVASEELSFSLSSVFCSMARTCFSRFSVEDLATLLQQIGDSFCIAETNLSGGDFVHQLLRCLRQFHGGAHRQGPRFERQLSSPRKDMAEQDPEHLSIPFLGEGESLAHTRLRVAV